MNTQPEALRLAGLLETDGWPDAAAELRRLHEENQALRQALDKPEIDQQALVQMAVLAEREACAKFLEGIINAPDMKACANAIRARSEK